MARLSKIPRTAGAPAPGTTMSGAAPTLAATPPDRVVLLVCAAVFAGTLTLALVAIFGFLDPTLRALGAWGAHDPYGLVLGSWLCIAGLPFALWEARRIGGRAARAWTILFELALFGLAVAHVAYTLS